MNVIDFADAKGALLRKRFLPQLRTLGKFTEYCLIPDYDETVDFEGLERVQVDDVRVHLLKVDGRYLLASILFAEEDFTLDEAVSWLFEFGVLLEPEARYEHSVVDALDIVLGLTFHGQPLVKYGKGPYEVFYYPEEFDEVLETFEQNEPEPVDFGAVEYREFD